MNHEAQTEMDFNQWRDMAQQDPEAFEVLRQQMVAQVIESAPPRVRKRLRGLQWRIDQVRRRRGSAMGSCLELYDMMWDTLIGEAGMMARMEQVARRQVPDHQAEVIDLRQAAKN